MLWDAYAVITPMQILKLKKHWPIACDHTSELDNSVENVQFPRYLSRPIPNPSSVNPFIARTISNKTGAGHVN